MTELIQTYTLTELPVVAAQLLPILSKRSILTLTGQLGAGKTTLVQALLRQLGVAGPITSPTFTYVNQYYGTAGQLIYHFDLYRLSDLASFRALGFDEYLLEPDCLVLIEWPEIIAELLATMPQQVAAAQLICQPDQTRCLQVHWEGSAR